MDAEEARKLAQRAKEQREQAVREKDDKTLLGLLSQIKKVATGEGREIEVDPLSPGVEAILTTGVQTGEKRARGLGYKVTKPPGGNELQRLLDKSAPPPKKTWTISW